jgi:DNA-directed RNA polymerase specialized sigma subunit
MSTATVMPKRKRSEHYVNNKEFLEALIDYRQEVKIAAEKEIPGITNEQLKKWKSPNRPQIPKYIGECFLKIATHLSYKTNFINYIFIDDMISDGIENCVQYVNNFDPEKSKNPFAYFTQVIHYAFLRRIQKEKRQLEIKNKILERTGYSEVFCDDNTIDGENYSNYNSIKENVHIKLRY